ncbi:hypothetical protein GCM10010358_45630 [Streptomyces minutiscleroticus]|uniref:Uncharacterized protein n=1 Tax=Streptomyces minutiscleroticus TaxID=68238 RepID=A0A918NPV3_9ACTN|nr:hypothetical protein GCM10010358_45630 [Streptomyces minutiscleroticus]
MSTQTVAAGAPARPATAVGPAAPAGPAAPGGVDGPGGAAAVSGAGSASGATGVSGSSGAVSADGADSVGSADSVSGSSGSSGTVSATGSGGARAVGRAVRTHFGTVAGAGILAVLAWRLGSGVFVDGLRRVDAPTLLAALLIGLATTVLSAWRWCLVARGLAVRLPFGPAVADYYRALFLNAALPGGVLGDVHRAVRHGRDAGDVGRGVRAVVLERTAGQAVLVVAGAAVLLTLPSPVREPARDALGAAGPAVACLVLMAACTVLALRRRGTAAASPAPRRPSAAGPGRVRAALAEARAALLARGAWPGVLLSSVLVLAGHLLMFVLAARAAGVRAPVSALVPIALLALLAMGLPLNVGGWGPREGVTAWAFGAAGLGATAGLTVAVVYGVLSFAASLPGLCVLLARRFGGVGRRGAGDTAQGAPDGRHPGADVRPRARPARSQAPAARVAAPSEGSASRIERYGAKHSTSPARSSFPLAADAREGRPMTPDSV